MNKLLDIGKADQGNVVFFVGRLVVSGFYLYAGIDNLLNLNEKIGYVAYKGVPYPMLSIIVASCLLLFGGMSILTGYRPTLGIVAVILFLIPVTLLMHNFWTIAEPEMRLIEKHAFSGNVALIGSALILLGVPQPWAWRLESVAARAKKSAAEVVKVNPT